MQCHPQPVRQVALEVASWAPCRRVLSRVMKAKAFFVLPRYRRLQQHRHVQLLRVDLDLHADYERQGNARFVRSMAYGRPG